MSLMLQLFPTMNFDKKTKKTANPGPMCKLLQKTKLTAGHYTTKMGVRGFHARSDNLATQKVCTPVLNDS